MRDFMITVKEFIEKVKPLIMSEIAGDKGAVEKQQDERSGSPENPGVPMVDISREAEAPAPSSGWLNMTTAVINGAGVGLLLGALLGLSISAVVSGVIGTLSGLLVLMLGINEKYMNPLKSIRIGSFGFFCVAGIVLGMNIRVNKILLPTRRQMMNDYRAIGFTKKEALDFIAFREFGLAPAGSFLPKAASEDQPVSEHTGKIEPANHNGASEKEERATKTVHPASDQTGAVAANSTRQFVNAQQSASEAGSVLYSSEVDTGPCYILNMADTSQPVAEIRDKFERAGGTWKELAQALDKELPEKVYVNALLTLRECLCQPGQSGKYKIKITPSIRKISSSHSLEQIRQAMKNAGGALKTIDERVGSDIPVEYQKSLFLTIIKIFKS
jgi:hypothetical protein